MFWYELSLNRAGEKAAGIAGTREGKNRHIVPALTIPNRRQTVIEVRKLEECGVALLPWCRMPLP